MMQTIQKSSSYNSLNTKSILRTKSVDSIQLNSSESSLHSSSSCCSRQLSSSVRFRNVKIREYGITLGDNPSCSGGPPISLSWDYEKEAEKVLSLDSYEECRDGQRRSMYQMKVPSDIRLDTLKSLNISIKDMIMTQAEIEKIKKQRAKTMKREKRKQITKENIKHFTCRLKRIGSLGRMH